MAYMAQEKKAKIAEALKLVVPKGWKYHLSVKNHSSICFTGTLPESLRLQSREEWLARFARHLSRWSCTALQDTL